MASHTVPVLSLQEKLASVLTFGNLSASSSHRFGRKCSETQQTDSLAANERRAAGWPLIRILLVSMMSAGNGRLSAKQARLTVKPTGEEISGYCERNSIKHTTVTLACGKGVPEATLHEVGVAQRASAGMAAASNRALLYFHGGGYVMSANTPHVPFGRRMARSAGADRLFFLEYTLAPESQYPNQLVQAVYALQYLIEHERLAPSQILIGGDSAGGNLSLALLAHLKLPSPYAPVIDLGGQKLKAAALISPWVTNSLRSTSYRENGDKDFLNDWKVEAFMSRWNPKPELWADCFQCKSGFWKDVPAEHIIMTAGSWEVFRDDIVKLCRMMNPDGKKDGTVKLIMGESEIHAQGFLDLFAGLPPPSSAMQLMAALEEI